MNLIMALSIRRWSAITRVDIGQLKAICDKGVCHVIAGERLLLLLARSSSSGSLLLVHDCHGDELAVFDGRKSSRSLASKEAGRLLNVGDGGVLYEALMVEQRGRSHSGGTT